MQVLNFQKFAILVDIMKFNTNKICLFRAQSRELIPLKNFRNTFVKINETLRIETQNLSSVLVFGKEDKHLTQLS